mmetsp:Transcript_30808/g.35566  ORF Transcript_30808/g.35566 Transcript_30808/m.35566 type:complete len:229 (+) Transcript_30808:121-807(+)|eukprot:CAMPEP_0194393434 /NCGR_PEP_ID=MMETSP0174-20130528/123294_1 /TAXON_ID=216777 /ORGANISM="Proboscia alata, Strain PI-D3" /LENGTH=228 /DNA_ID=CAMNT_0039189115 /DNA_START=1183 /DNA_END=1869 /DNA_ORIENTATION=+
MTLAHKELRGKERLYNVVSCLSKNCPWTISQTSNKMIEYLESEVKELKNELLPVESVKEASMKEEKNAILSVKGNSRAIVSELGDVIFDVLMLEMMLQREYGFDAEEAWQVASEKVERRTPYVREWGDGVTAPTTIEDTKKIWQEVKKREKDHLETKKQVTENVKILEKDDESNKRTTQNLQMGSFKTINDVLVLAFRSNFVRSSTSTAALGFLFGVFITKLMMRRPA